MLGITTRTNGSLIRVSIDDEGFSSVSELDD